MFYPPHVVKGNYKSLNGARQWIISTQPDIIFIHDYMS